MQSGVNLAWQIQHHSKAHPALVHTMCMQPPDLSVGVRHLGQGFVRIRIAVLEASYEESAALWKK